MDRFLLSIKKYVFAACVAALAALALLIADMERFSENARIAENSESPLTAREKVSVASSPAPSEIPSSSGLKKDDMPPPGARQRAEEPETSASGGPECASPEEDAALSAAEREDGGESSEDGPKEKIEGSKEIISGTVGQGDTAAKLLGGDVHTVLQASGRYHSLANIRSGQPYVVIRDRETRALERFEYEIDAHRKLVVESGGAGLSSRVEQIVYDIRLVPLHGTVESSLFQSVAALGESPSLAVVTADVFRWDVDFIRDVQDGDTFSMLVEKRFRDGQFRNYGRVLGATFTNKGKTFEAFLFRGVSGLESHYNKKGESLRKVLLKAPLAFTRITSGYSRGRKHPIFHDVRPHEGVDYAAPTGTPIKAVGDGVVVRRGWRSGYGNTLTLRHGAGLESQYGHMSGYARGMAAGARVRQGQVIGFVGMTGWATGPHLDFRLKQNGRFIDPTKAVNPREKSIVPAQMRAFGERIVRVRALLAGEVSPDDYNHNYFQ